jgi:hypothetical protein
VNVPNRMVLPGVGLILILTLAAPVAISADVPPSAPPILSSPRSQPEKAPLPGRVVLWSQPPDLNGYKFDSFEFEWGDYRVADDFTLPSESDITRVTFWGGPYLGLEGDPGPTVFNVQILDDWSCYPRNILLELPGVNPEMTFEGYDGNGDAVYSYGVDLVFHAETGTVYWLVAQAVIQDYPPLWGWQQAADEFGCAAMFYDDWYAEWSECGNMLGYPYDAAFELIDATGPEGACCRADGSCVVVVRQVCEAEGGAWLGPDFACDPDPCAQETGACCVPITGCLIESVSDCMAAGGAWQGVGTTCHPDPCEPTPVEKTTWGAIKAGYR